MKSSTKDSFAPQLSVVRSFLFGALTVVWFTEMVFLGFQSLSRVWTDLWQVVPPQNPQLVPALSMIWAVAAPVKGALFIMTVFALRSRDGSLRTALFVPMALIPPLNLIFPFRQQGFLLEPVMVATVLSLILWGSFFLFRESVQQPEQKGTRYKNALPPSWWEIFQHVWFVVYAMSVTLVALLLLLWPGTALKLILPCLSSAMKTNAGDLSGLTHSAMASGTHLLALATACWIATASYRSNLALRKAMAAASTVHAALVLIFPLRQVVLGLGAGCATSSILAAFVPMLVGWVLCMASGSKAKSQTRQEAYI